MLTSKICRRCKKDLPIEQFYKSRNNPDGVDFQCKECNRAGQKAYKAMKAQETPEETEAREARSAAKKVESIAKADHEGILFRQLRTVLGMAQMENDIRHLLLEAAWLKAAVTSLAKDAEIQLSPEVALRPAPVAEPVVESVAVVPLAPPEVSVVRKALDPETGVPYAETDDHHNDAYIAERYGR